MGLHCQDVGELSLLGCRPSFLRQDGGSHLLVGAYSASIQGRNNILTDTALRQSTCAIDPLLLSSMLTVIIALIEITIVFQNDFKWFFSDKSVFVLKY